MINTIKLCRHKNSLWKHVSLIETEVLSFDLDPGNGDGGYPGWSRSGTMPKCNGQIWWKSTDHHMTYAGKFNTMPYLIELRKLDNLCFLCFMAVSATKDMFTSILESKCTVTASQQSLRFRDIFVVNITFWLLSAKLSSLINYGDSASQDNDSV